MKNADFDSYFRHSALARYQRSRCEAGTLPVRLMRVDSPAHETVDPPTADLVIALILSSSGAARWSWDGAAANHTPERLPGSIGITPFGASGAFDIAGRSSILLITMPRATIDGRLGGESMMPRDLGELHDAYCERPWIRTLCLRLWKTAGANAFGRDLQVDALCEALLSALIHGETPTAEEAGCGGLGAGEQRRLAEIAELCEPDVDALANGLGMPIRTFRRRFKTAYGMSPHRWLILQRIEKAKRLLRSTEVPLCELAMDLGFAHQAHFTEAFVRATGRTPGRYRNEG